jgi:hypothetical protein
MTHRKIDVWDIFTPISHEHEEGGADSGAKKHCGADDVNPFEKKVVHSLLIVGWLCRLQNNRKPRSVLPMTAIA